MIFFKRKSFSFNLITGFALSGFAVSGVSFILFLFLFGTIFVNRTLERNREFQRKWISSYSKTIIEDLRLGRQLSVERKLEELIEDGMLNRAEIHFSGQTIFKERSSNGDQPESILHNVIHKILKVEDFSSLSEPLRDDQNTVWGTITADFSQENLVNPLENDLGHFLIFYVSFNLVSLALISLLFGPLEESINELKQTIVSKISIKRARYISSENEIAYIQQAFEEYEIKIRESEELLKERSKLIAASEIAAQVAHDVKSPLASLQMAVRAADNLPEDLRIIVRTSVSRIKDIVDSLVRKTKEVKTTLQNEQTGDATNVAIATQIELISEILETTIAQQRLQYLDHNSLSIQYSGVYGAFAKLNLVEFTRTITNIINNAVEAAQPGQQEQTVNINLSDSGKFWTISISDNGKGIAQEKLHNLGVRGNTFDKTNGSGLGLYHARQTLESIGGSVKIHSIIGIGTTVELKIPKADAPKWFVHALIIHSNSKVVVIDDDLTIHNIWEQHLRNACPNLEILNFFSTTDFFEWHRKNYLNDCEHLFLVDHEFKSDVINGIQLIERAAIADRSILVTNRYEDMGVRDICTKHEIGLLPKSMATAIPIELVAVSPETVNVDPQEFH